MNVRRGRALGMILGLLAIAACSKEKESLVVVALTSKPAAPDLRSVAVTVGDVAKTFPLQNGLSMTALSIGVYVPARITGTVTVKATATGADCSAGYRGTGSATIAAAGVTANAAVMLSLANTCQPDGGGGTGGAGMDGGGGTDGGGGGAGGGSGGAGGGAGGTGGGTGGTGGGTGGTGGTSDGGTDAPPQVVPPPSLTRCMEIHHNAATQPACDIANGVADAAIWDVLLTRDGKYLLTAGDDGRIKVWSWNGGAPTDDGHVLSTSGQAYMALSPNGTLLAAGSKTGRLTLWTVGGTWAVAGNPTGITDDIYGLAFSPDGSQLFIADHSGKLSVMSMATMAITSSITFSVAVWVVDASPAAANGQFWVAVGLSDGRAAIMSATGGTLSGQTVFMPSATVDYGTTTVRFSPDGRLLAAGAEDGTFGVWAVPITAGATPTAPPFVVAVDDVSQVAFSPAGDHVAVAAGFFGVDWTLGIWQVATRGNRGTAPTNYRPISVAFSANGGAIVAGEWDCGIVLVCSD